MILCGLGLAVYLKFSPYTIVQRINKENATADRFWMGKALAKADDIVSEVGVPSKAVQGSSPATEVEVCPTNPI